jgi:hypothetical protein
MIIQHKNGWKFLVIVFSILLSVYIKIWAQMIKKYYRDYWLWKDFFVETIDFSLGFISI